MAFRAREGERRTYRQSRQVQFFDKIHCLRSDAIINSLDYISNLSASGRNAPRSQCISVRSLYADCLYRLMKEATESYSVNNDFLL